MALNHENVSKQTIRLHPMEAEQTFSFLCYKVYLVELVISSCLGARKHIFICECVSDRDSDQTLGWNFNEILSLRFFGKKSSIRPVIG